MITDPRVFQEAFVPRDLKHRDREASLIEEALAPVVDGDRGSDVYCFGPSGTGKTTVAKYLLESLERAAPAHRPHYLNCWRHSSRYDVLYRLTRGLTGAVDLHRTSTPADELLDRLEAVAAQKVVILDEVDMLADPEVLYDLYHVPDLTLIHVANRDGALFEGLEERVSSRIRVGYRVPFEPYSVDQLVSILGARVRAGLDPDVVDPPRLERIARAADGDARVAIAALRTAARMATERSTDRITQAVIDEAVPRARRTPRGSPLESLGAHHAALVDLLLSAEDGLQPKRLYHAYDDRMGPEARSRRTVQKYLNELVERGHVREEGASQARRYHAVRQEPEPEASPS